MASVDKDIHGERVYRGAYARSSWTYPSGARSLYDRSAVPLGGTSGACVYSGPPHCTLVPVRAGVCGQPGPLGPPEQRRVDTRDGPHEGVAPRRAHEHKHASHPEVWGPAFWFTLHNGAANYPGRASALCARAMKHFIEGIPIMIPCAQCADHARAHIEASRDRLDDIVQTKAGVARFFVDFHNRVNRRYGKLLMSYEDASKLYDTMYPVGQFAYSK